MGVGVILGLVLLLLASGRLWVTSESARPLILARINAAMPGTLSWDRLRVSLLAGTVDLRGLRLDGPDGEALIALDRAFVNLSWGGLFRKTLLAEALILEKPRVWLATDAAGSLNLAGAFPASEPKGSESGALPFNVEIDTLELTDGFFRYKRQAPPHRAEEITFSGIDLTVTDADLAAQSMHMDLRTATGAIDMAGVKAALSPSRLFGTLNRGSVETAILDMDTDLGRLLVAGSLRDFCAPLVFDAEATLITTLGRLRRGFHLPTELTGPVRVHLTGHGTAANPEAALFITYKGGTIAGAPVNRADLACHLREKRLAVEEFSVESPLGRIKATGDIDLEEAFPEGLTNRPRDLEAIAYRLQLTQTGTSLDRLPGIAAKISGEVDATLTLGGTGISPNTLSAEAELALTARDLAVEKVPDPMDLAATARLALSNNRVTVRHLAMAAEGATLEGDGSWDLSSSAVAANLALAVPDLSRLTVCPAAAELKGRLTLDLKVRGTTHHPVADARLLGEALGVKGLPLGTLRLAAGLDPSGLLRITEMELKRDEARVRAQGTVRLFDEDLPAGAPTPFPVDMALDFANIDLRHYLSTAGLSGYVDGTLTCRGPLLSPDASLSVTGRSLAVGTHPLGDLSARLRLRRGLLTLDEARLANGQSKLTLEGSARVLEADTGAPLPTPAFDLVLEGEDLHLADAIEGTDGTVTVSGHLTGDTAHPRGTLSLSGKAMNLGVQKIQGLALDARLDKDRVTVDSLAVALAPNETLTADGWLSLKERQYALRANTTGIRLTHIEPIGGENAAEGTVRLTVTGAGSLDNPEMNGELTVSDLRLNNEPFDDGTIKLVIRDGLVRVDCDLVARLTGRYHLKTGQFQGKALLEQTRLEPFFKMAGRRTLTGTLTGHIEAEGNAAAPEAIRARARITRLAVSHNATELVSQGVCDATFENGTLHVPTLRLGLFHRGQLELSGTGSRDGALDFRAKGTLPLEVIHLFTEALGDLTGKINLAGRLKGTLDRPDFQGDLTLDGMGFTVPTLGQQLHDVSGRARITPETVTIEGLGGYLDKGRFDLSGALVMDQFSPVSVNARLSAHALPITLPDTLELLLSGDLNFAGTQKKSRIAGNITLLEGRYFKDVRLGLIDSFSTRRREAPPATDSSLPLFLKNTELNIALRHRTPFIVDNNIALMALRPTLSLYGPVGKPLVSGRAQVESGVISYLGKEFEITKGVVDFINPYKIEATIDVESQVKVRKWTITLSVSGVEDNLRFAMRSTPEESDADILSLLVFNKTQDEMISGEGGSNQSTKQLLADMVTRTLQGSLKEATGLDTLEMKYTERTDKEDADDVSITVGKELSKRITLKYGVGTKNGETVQSAISEYKFYENVMMNAFRDTDGHFGGELMFRLEMR